MCQLYPLIRQSLKINVSLIIVKWFLIVFWIQFLIKNSAIWFMSPFQVTPVTEVQTCQLFVVKTNMVYVCILCMIVFLYYKEANMTIMIVWNLVFRIFFDYCIDVSGIWL